MKTLEEKMLAAKEIVRFTCGNRAFVQLESDSKHNRWTFYAGPNPVDVTPNEMQDAFFVTANRSSAEAAVDQVLRILVKETRKREHDLRPAGHLDRLIESLVVEG